MTTRLLKSSYPSNMGKLFCLFITQGKLLTNSLAKVLWLKPEKGNGERFNINVLIVVCLLWNNYNDISSKNISTSQKMQNFSKQK